MFAGGVFRVRPVGDRACIVELPDIDRVLGVAARLRELDPPGMIDVVPAARTVLVVCVDRAAVRRVAETVAGFDERISAGEAAGDEVTIDVVYDGDDLAEVGELTGLGHDGVIAAHTETVWRAAFGGFAPGFVYLAGGDPRLEVPRLASPRTTVPMGSVALAGGLSAVYPGASPGGWRLIGRTGERMWDEARDRPARVAPGDTVRFRAVREVVRLALGEAGGQAPRDPRLRKSVAQASPAAPAAQPALTVLDPGLLTLVQDAGRQGHAALGVTASGALDRGALQRANLAVGNAPGVAGLEHLNGGLVLRAHRALRIAVTGAEAEIRVESAEPSVPRAVPLGDAVELSAGETLHIGAPRRGLRNYLAVQGGLATGREVLGSAAYDSLSGLGTPPLSSGDMLALGPEPGGARPDSDLTRSAAQPPTARRAVLRFVPGPRDDWFTADARAAFISQAWRVSPRSNRVGLRLDGDPLTRSRPGELATEGMTRGSVQVPPNGLPVLFLADHPVTGGYPVIGTVIDADLDRVAQLAPGAEVRFHPVDPDEPGEPLGLDAPVPETVSFTIEIDGRRHRVTVSGALAAALNRLNAAGDRAALAELLVEVVGKASR